MHTCTLVTATPMPTRASLEQLITKPPPPPLTDHRDQCGKKRNLQSGYLVGLFWVHKVLGPRPHPPGSKDALMQHKVANGTCKFT